MMSWFDDVGFAILVLLVGLGWGGIRGDMLGWGRLLVNSNSMGKPETSTLMLPVWENVWGYLGSASL